MQYNDKIYEETIALSPNDWLSWGDEKFNDWRRRCDFPRVVNFLFDSLPYFSVWLSEQKGLTEQDLLFHGPARFIRFYGEPITYIEHDVSVALFQTMPIIKRYDFIAKKDKRIDKLKVLRGVRFTSYIDWAYSNRSWVFPSKINDLRYIISFLTPSGITSETSDYLNSNSNIQWNIPLFMPNISVSSLSSFSKVKAPPRLELLKLGGNNIEVVDGFVGEKNLEFTNIDNLTLISPVITSFQEITFSTLRNFNLIGSVHAATFHQCSIDIKVKDGGLSDCDFEYGNSKIELYNSKLYRCSIKERWLNVKLKDTEVTDCSFKCFDIFNSSVNEKEKFNRSAKMIFSHLGYPDLAGEHFFLEKKEKRKGLWKQLFSSKRVGLKCRVFSLFSFIRMSFQELYWGYGERPFNIINFSLLITALLSLFGYFSHCSSTYHDLGGSLIFSLQSFTNISITEIKQEYEIINLIGSFMSFIGLMSVGLLVASLSAKTKNYN